MRFGEPPTFLALNQVVSGYTLQGTAGANLELFPSARASTFWGFSGSTQYTDRPTFTLTPVTGERFVESYLRPLPPQEMLALLQNGVPVDVLFRLFSQSIGGLQNTYGLQGRRQSGSGEFLELLAGLRRLQLGQALRMRISRDGGRSRAFVTIDTGSDPALNETANRVHQLLGTDRRASELEVVYGARSQRANGREIHILTRSLLHALFAVAAEMELPVEDVQSGRALPTARSPGMSRAVIIVRSGSVAPASAYTAVEVDGRWYWIDDTDFDSKFAFMILELVKSIAESTRGMAAPTLTIPAG